jgi:hypothetical protein
MTSTIQERNNGRAVYTSSGTHREVQTKCPISLHCLNRVTVVCLILGLWLLSLVVASLTGAPAYANTTSTLASRYNDLVQRQATLFYTNAQLSTLRVQYMYAQLWFLYKDPSYAYWHHVLDQRLQQLQQVDPTALAQAVATLKQLAATSPRTDPCAGSANSLLCVVQSTQQLMAWLTERSQYLVTTSEALAGFRDWAQRWEAGVRNAPGFPELERAWAQFNLDFPAFTDYVHVSQEVATQIAEVLTKPSVTYAVAVHAQTLAHEVATLLDRTNYTPMTERLRAQWEALLAATPRYQALQGEATRVTTALRQLQQAIHDTVASCQQRGYGDQCFSPGFNTSLQAVLPQFRSDRNQVLVEAAQLAETSAQFWLSFSQRVDVQALDQAAREILQTTMAPVLPALQQAQPTFNAQVLAIPEVHTQVGALWAQMVALGQKLGLVD